MRPYSYVPEGPVWMNGKLVPASEGTVLLTEPAMQSGLGVFETAAVRGGVPIDLDQHLVRLAHGAEVLEVPLPPREDLAAAGHTIAAAVDGGYGWLKIIAVRSGACAVFGGRMDPAEEGKCVSAVLLKWRQNEKDAIAGLKTLNYASHILGLEEARRRGADDGIWLNTRGHLAEGCTSTLFLARKRTLYTPSLADGILPGIVRGFVLEAARKLGLRIHEGKIRLKRLETADEAFLTSSLRGVRPLVRFEGRPVGSGEPGPMTRAISRQVEILRGIRPGERR